MKIKGTPYTFKQLSVAHNAQEFQEQINIIQENIKHCRRDIDNFDVYHITRAIADLDDIDAVKSKLLPGEAAVISAPTQGKWHTGQVIIRLNDLEYVTVEPFQTGTYYPAAITSIANNGETPNYLLTYRFTATPPLKGEGSLSEVPTLTPYEQMKASNIQIPTEQYYYGFVNTQNTDQVGFLLPLTGTPITFPSRKTKPILKFFIVTASQIEQAETYEEVSLCNYALVLTGTAESGTYTLTVINPPENCYVAVK